MAGVEFSPSYQPSWQPLLPKTIQRVSNIGANWLVLDPTWSITRANPPVMEPVAGRDALWPDLETTIQQAKSQGLKVAVKPTLSYPDISPETCIETPCPTAADLWWDEGARDFSWWLVWFDHYRQFILHHADLAALTGADALVIEGDHLNPALPGGLALDGSPSGVFSDAETRWRDLISEVRQHYSGTLVWSLSSDEGQIVPPFLDAFDEVIMDWQVDPLNPDSPQPALEELQAQFDQTLDGRVKEIQTGSGKPLIVSIAAPSNPDMLFQLNVYEALLSSLSQRDWINGVISSGYYPPAELQDSSNSVHGKSAEALLQMWFPVLVSAQP